MSLPSVRQPERSTRNFSRAMERDGYQCRYCGDPADCVDHIVPVSYRSDNTMGNLAAACTRCNLTAHARWFPSFDAKRAYILEARGLPLPPLPPPPPDPPPDPAPDPPLGPLVTVLDAVWGEAEDDGWPVPEDAPDIMCAGTNKHGKRCGLLAEECTFHV